MEYDIDYEIYKYINNEAENYVSFDELLRSRGLEYADVEKQMNKFQERFFSLLDKYSINTSNLVAICFDLMEKINLQPENTELQYLYICIMTDFGLLNDINSSGRTAEQMIRNFFHQDELVSEISDFLENQKRNSLKLRELREYLNKPRRIKFEEYSEEFDFLYHLTIQHTFLHKNIGNEVYKDNLNYLLAIINNDEKLKSLKPYIIYAVLSRKTGMMQEREHFIPNIKAVFQYQQYNIYRDNGKNFNDYQSKIEFYDHLIRSYSDDDIDIELCDFCFANLSPLSEWYYVNCQQDLDIPMLLTRKIYLSKPLSFPMLFCYDDYINYDIDEFKCSKIWNKWEKIINSDMTEDFLQCLYNNKDKSEILEKLPYYEGYSQYAELFMYQYAEQFLEEKMLDTALKFIEI